MGEILLYLGGSRFTLGGMPNTRKHADIAHLPQDEYVAASKKRANAERAKNKPKKPRTLRYPDIAHLPAAEYRKEAHRRAAEAWRRAHPEKQRAAERASRKPKPAGYYRERLYGVTPEQYAALLRAQGGKCGICKAPLATPFVDHCHGSKAVRGLLCRHCNTGLGMFKDSPEALLEAAAYLERSRASESFLSAGEDEDRS